MGFSSRNFDLGISKKVSKLPLKDNTVLLQDIVA